MNQKNQSVSEKLTRKDIDELRKNAEEIDNIRNSLNQKNQEEREEGVYYDESVPNDCCDKCHDVTFEKTYPAHTAYHACLNLKCECHQKNQDGWEEKFINKFKLAFKDDLDEMIIFIRDLLSQERDNWEGEFLNQPANQHDQAVRAEAQKELKAEIKRWAKKQEKNKEMQWTPFYNNQDAVEVHNKALDDLLKFIKTLC